MTATVFGWYWLDQIAGDRRTLLIVAADGAEGDLEALLGELRDWSPIR